MSDHDDMPQGVATLADAEQGARVIVHSVISTRGLPPGARALVAGEGLVCTRLLDDSVEFERADGTRFRVGRQQAVRVRIDRIEPAHQDNDAMADDAELARADVSADEAPACNVCRL